MFEYTYFITCLLLFVPWVTLFLSKRDLRKAMIFVGILGSLTAFTDFLFIPEYWNPKYIFEPIYLGINIRDSFFGLGITIEDALFGFFLVGIAAIPYEYLAKRTLRKLPNKKHHFVFALIFFLIIFIGLEIILPTLSIYNHIIALFTGALVVLIQRPDLSRQVFLSGIFMSIIYMTIFKILDLITGSVLYSTKFNIQNLSGYEIWGIPSEEILFAFGVGIMVSSIYGCLNDFRTAGTPIR